MQLSDWLELELYSLSCLSAMENQVINTFSPAFQPWEKIPSDCKSLKNPGGYICQEYKEKISALKDPNSAVAKPNNIIERIHFKSVSESLIKKKV